MKKQKILAAVLCSVLTALILMPNSFATDYNTEEDSDIRGNIEALAENMPVLAVYDVTNEALLFEKETEKRVPPASTAKLVTALVALQYADTEEIFTVGTELQLLPEDISISFIEEGHRLKTKTFIAGMLLPSGCDSAYSLAVNIARKATENTEMTDEEALSHFVSLMNEYCTSLGCRNTNFVNPDGTDAENNYTSAEDMLLIALEAIKNEKLMTIAQTAGRKYYFASGENVLWNNTNLLLVKGSGYYCPYVKGLKTGTSEKAGYCLITSAESIDRQLIVVTYGCKNDRTRFGGTRDILEAVLGFPVITGDADEDGTVSAADARFVLRASVGLEKTTERHIRICDIDNDNTLTASDARSILRRSVGLEESTI